VHSSILARTLMLSLTDSPCGSSCPRLTSMIRRRQLWSRGSNSWLLWGCFGGVENDHQHYMFPLSNTRKAFNTRGGVAALSANVKPGVSHEPAHVEVYGVLAVQHIVCFPIYLSICKKSVWRELRNRVEAVECWKADSAYRIQCTLVHAKAEF
jgi:hypothetical protein